jgi:hypothetical protein
MRRKVLGSQFSAGTAKPLSSGPVGGGGGGIGGRKLNTGMTNVTGTSPQTLFVQMVR